jgi:hypothetical protein
MHTDRPRSQKARCRGTHDQSKPGLRALAFDPGLSVEWAPVEARISDDGTLGTTIGDATIRTARGEKKTKYLTVWRRGADGRYLVILDIGNEGWTGLPKP